MTAAVVCVVIGAVLPVAFAVVSGVAVAAVSGAVSGGFASPAGHRLLVAIVIVGGLLAAQQTLSPIQEALTSVLARRVQGRTYRRSLVAALEPRTVAHLEDPHLLDLVNAATVLTPGGPNGAVRSLLSQARRFVSAIAALLLLAHFHWWLAAALLVVELRLLRSNRLMYNQLIAFRVLHLPGLRRSVYLRGLAMNPEAAKETRIFGLAGWVVDRFRTAWLGTMAEVWQRRRGNAGRLAVAVVPVVAVQFLAAWLIGRAAVDHR